MKITFPCHGCGRKLKARPDSVGRTRKCPVCATRVTCPERLVAANARDLDVLDAEVVPAAPAAAAVAREKAPAFNPYVDADDEPYKLAGPDPAATSAPEPKRPCPMCGEMILVSAVKCRFCGEVLDKSLLKGKAKRRSQSFGTGLTSTTRIREIAGGLLCMALGIGLTVASFASASEDDPNSRRFILFYGLILGGFVQMCRGIFGLITDN
jgi:predicted nucleic acid-binding Zn ribbon protein